MVNPDHATQKKTYLCHEHHCISVLAVGFLAFCIVGGISYAAYLFIDATHVSDASGIHITKNFSLAISGLKGKLYSNESLGIKDWMVYADRKNGFEIKYPNNWEMQKNADSFLFLKKYKDSSSKNSSLSASVEVGNIFLEEGGDLKIAVAKRGIAWSDVWKEEMFSGRMGIRTGKVKTDDGLVHDWVLWKDEQNSNVFYLEATYFTDKSAEFENIFNNMISEFKFI